MPNHFCLVQIALVSLRGMSFGVTISAVSRKTSEPKKWKKLQLEEKLLPPTASISMAEVDKELFLSVLPPLNNDNISSVARHNQVILQFGTAILDKVGKKNANYVSQRKRQLARLLIILQARRHEKEAMLESFIDTSKYDDLVEAFRLVRI